MSASICETLWRTSLKSEHFKLKRVKSGFLQIDRAYELTQCLLHQKPIPAHLHVAEFQPCHAAFAHRFGLCSELPESYLMTALTPPDFSAAARIPLQEEMLMEGADFIKQTAEEFVHLNYPKLLHKGRRLAVQTFCWSKNLASLGKIFGLDHALRNVIGLCEPLPKGAKELADRIKFLILPSYRNKLRESNPAEYELQMKYDALREEWISHSLTCLIGACKSHYGLDRTKTVLLNRLFSGFFLPKHLIRSKNPAIDLAKYVKEKHGQLLTFRLLGESGRLSHNSMFVVGVYLGKSCQKMGEGYGASKYLAQQRAALDALRKLQLT